MTLVYYTENNDEVFSTPYLNVRLKTENDIDLLSSYAEKYKLRFDDYKPLLSLWYVLSVTIESEKSPLQIANELYETGKFASSQPDLASCELLHEPTFVRSFAESNKENIVYDLSGLKVIGAEANSSLFTLHSSLKKGVYIQNGKKVAVK